MQNLSLSFTGKAPIALFQANPRPQKHQPPLYFGGVYDQDGDDRFDASNQPPDKRLPAPDASFLAYRAALMPELMTQAEMDEWQLQQRFDKIATDLINTEILYKGIPLNPQKDIEWLQGQMLALLENLSGSSTHTFTEADLHQLLSDEHQPLADGEEDTPDTLTPLPQLSDADIRQIVTARLQEIIVALEQEQIMAAIPMVAALNGIQHIDGAVFERAITEVPAAVQRKSVELGHYLSAIERSAVLTATLEKILAECGEQ